jgi:hypothetical protein
VRISNLQIQRHFLSRLAIRAKAMSIRLKPSQPIGNPPSGSKLIMHAGTPKRTKERLPALGDDRMAQQNQGTHNSPSHEAQVKGGQQSHSGSSQGNMGNQGNQGKQGTQGTGSHNQPSHEASVKGGEHSHSGSKE